MSGETRTALHQNLITRNYVCHFPLKSWKTIDYIHSRKWIAARQLLDKEPGPM